jgi:hypothetical protein
MIIWWEKKFQPDLKENYRRKIMSVEKTFSITIKFERDTVGLSTSGSSQGSSKTIAALSESDDEYTTLKAIVLKRVTAVVPISQGDVSAHIVGSVVES